MAHGTKLRVEEYNKIKMFITEGVPKATVRSITGRSAQTVKLIGDSTSYENYNHLQMVKNGYIDMEGNRINKYDHHTKKEPVVVEEPKPEPTDYHVTTSADQIVTSVNNLTEAVITMTAVMDRIATDMAIEKSKSFFKR